MTTTSFTPKSTTVGCEPDIYMNGYVYPAGPYAVGSRCYAPILELFNCCQDCLTVRFASRVSVEANENALDNCLSVPSKGYTLLMGILPSSGDMLSKIFIEDSCGNVECYVLEHDQVHGYNVRCLNECAETPLKMQVSRTPYVPQFCGCSVPIWKNTVIVPLRASKCAMS